MPGKPPGRKISSPTFITVLRQGICGGDAGEDVDRLSGLEKYKTELGLGRNTDTCVLQFYVLGLGVVFAVTTTTEMLCRATNCLFSSFNDGLRSTRWWGTALCDGTHYCLAYPGGRWKIGPIFAWSLFQTIGFFGNFLISL